MSAAANARRTPAWRLDSLADAARSKEREAAAAAGDAAHIDDQQQDTPEPDNHMKRQKSGFFSSTKEVGADVLPSGLNSTVEGTHSNLQWLMTLQFAALPEDLPAGEGFDTLEDNPAGFEAFDHFQTIQEDSSMPSAAAATQAAAASAGQDSADLMATAAAAPATAAADTFPATNPGTGPSWCSSVNSTSSPPACSSPQRRTSLEVFCESSASVFAAAVPPSLRNSSDDNSMLQALQGLQVMPSMRHSTLMSSRSMRSTGLPRASTLKVMESSHAWETLKGNQEQQQDSDTIDSTPPQAHSSSQATPVAAAAGAAAAASASTGSKTQLQQSSDEQKDSRGSSSSFVKSLAGLSFSSFGSAVTSRISYMLNSQPPNAPFSSSLKKTAHTTLSTDGWTLHLVHCHDTSLQPSQRKRHPIVMCPGLATSGPGTFDLLPHVSLTDFLAAAGWDVWVVDIRGNGLADKSSRIDVEQGWNIDDYLVQDVPACIEYVLKNSPCKADKLHWIGHSMGGMLASGLCSQAGKWSKKLRSVMLLGSGCFGDGSWHVLLKKLVVPVTSLGFPAHITTQGLALLADTPVALSVFETLFYWPTNMEKLTRKALLTGSFNFIPAKLVGQFLASHGSASGLTNSRGSFLYADPDVLGMCKVPVLGVNGDWDLFCPAAGGARNVDLFAGPKQHITVGPAHGYQAHYGHFDVIVGRKAQQEVWPHLTAFLEQHDVPASLRQLWDVQLLGRERCEAQCTNAEAVHAACCTCRPAAGVGLPAYEGGQTFCKRCEL